MTSSRALLLMVVFVLVAAVAPTPVAARDSETAIEGEFTGTVPVDQTNGSTFLWEEEPNTLKVTFNATNQTKNYKVCVRDGGEEPIDCKSESADSGPQTVQFDYENLSAFEGSSNVTVILLDASFTQPKEFGNDTINFTTIARNGDIDEDGLSNANELANNTSMYIADTDKDSLDDGDEVRNYATSPTKADTDGDGLSDAYEVVYRTDPTNADTDADGLSDGLENKLRTDPTDGSTTSKFLFAGGTLFGVAAVGSHWILGSRRHRSAESIRFLSHLFGVPSSPDEESSNDDGLRKSDSESVTPPKFDEEEPRQSSRPILTDEDRVIQLLGRNGGWMYQGRIVEETDWSKSKVSRLLSRMDDDGVIEKVSVGRQNIVAEEGSLPEGARSPFEE